MAIFLAPRMNIVRLLNDYARPLGAEDFPVEDEVLLRHYAASFESLAVVSSRGEEEDAVSYHAIKRGSLTPQLTGMTDEELEAALGDLT